MSRTISYTETIEMITETCCNCGMIFGITKAFQSLARVIPAGKEWGLSFYCPAGHSQAYQGTNAADALRLERDRLQQRIAQKDDEIKAAWATATHQREVAEAERRRANGHKGYAAKLAKRAKAGVCPCCNRQFADMHRHMSTKHPQFAAETPSEAPEPTT